MKTILIKKTFTTIALISTIQCGYGTGSGTEDDPRVLTSWGDIINSNNSTCDDKNTSDTSDDVYTLRDYIKGGDGTYYKFLYGVNPVSLEKNLVIPKRVWVTNNGKIWMSCTYLSDSRSLTISDGTFTNNYQMWFTRSGSLTISGGTFTNNANNDSSAGVYVDDHGSLTISGGTFTNKNRVEIGSSGSSFTSSLTISGNGSLAMKEGSKLSFNKYGKFSVDDNSLHDVELNGTIEIKSANASVNLTNMNFSGSGTIDMSPLRPYPEEYLDNLKTPTVFDNHDFFTFGASQSLPKIKLPFNCNFGYTDSENVEHYIDLSNATTVSYTVLKLVEPTIVDNVIKENIIGTYGDYAAMVTNPETEEDVPKLGVTLPKAENEDVDTSKVHVTTKYRGNKSLSDLVSEMDGDQLKYNKRDYKLLTTDLTDATDSIASGATHTYHFGFIGEKAISIIPEEEAENTKAIFDGDNSGYDVAPVIEVSEVEFANKSLFQFSHEYGKGTFKSLQEFLQELQAEDPNNPAIQNLTGLSNTIPANKTVTFTGGFTLGVGHTLVVKGTLVG